MEDQEKHRTPALEAEEEEGEEFGELIRYTLIGYVGGLIFGAALDALGFQRSAVGQWLVRTISGEGESLLEGLFALRRRLKSRAYGMAEAYGWGKFIGMTIPWWIDWGSRAMGVDVYGVQGFYIPFFYSMSDQIGANVSGLVFLRRGSGSWRQTLQAYFKHPVMISGLIIILVVPIGLFLARLLGFSPSTQVLTALETIASNLCWIPPLMGYLSERRIARDAEPCRDEDHSPQP
jgi:hypothetical protein